MDCQQAREQIDQRLQEQVEGKADGRRDWSELDAHLASCPKCSADWLELLRTRNLLIPLAEEGPTPKEVDSMWQAVQTAGPGPVQTIGRPTRRGLYRYLAACAGIAAVLFIAFQLGTWQYGLGIDWPTPTDTMQRRVPAMAEVATGSVGPGVQAPTADARRTFLRSEHMSTRQPPTKGFQPAASPEETSEVDGLSQVLTKQVDGNALHLRWQPASANEPGRGTEAFWELIRNGEIDIRQYTCPSPGDVNADGLAGVAAPVVVGTEFDLAPPPSPPARPDHGATTYKLRHASPGKVADAIKAILGRQARSAGGERFSIDVDENSHSLTVTASEGDQAIVAELIPVLEMPPTAPSSSYRIHTLKHADPAEVADKLNKTLSLRMFEGHRGEGPAQVVANRRTNALFISASDAELEWIGEVLEQIDVPQEQAQNGVQAERAAARPGEAESAQRSSHARAKIIKTGELTVEVTDYDAAVEHIEAAVREHGGFVADGATQEGTGGALVGRAVIRVLPERFEALFAALKAIGRVESENVKAADVTAEYVDLEARIASLRITEQRLQELVKSKSFIDKVSSLLEVEREMTRVRSQIEQLQGQLRVMADRVAMSTITVTFREPPRMVPSASMSVEVPILTDAADALAEALARLNGRLTSGKTSKRDDGTLKGDYKLQISLARFGELLDAVTDLGRVEERQILDWQFGHASAPWANRTECYVALVLFERSRPLPTGTVRVEVDALDAALEALTSVLASCDGSITSNKTTRQKDGSSVGELKLSVPAGRFAELTDRLASLGRTTAKQVAGEAGQIVGGAASVLCELSLTLAERPRQVPVGHMAIEVAQFQAARQALSDLVARGNIQVLESSSNQRDDGTWIGGFRLGIKAGDMEDVVARLESLGRVQSRQISGLGLGDLSRIDPDALGTLGVALAEKATISPAPERAGGSIRDRLRDGLAGLYTSLGLILYGLVVMAPWLIIMLAGAWAIMWLRRKRQPAAKATSSS